MKKILIYNLWLGLLALACNEPTKEDNTTPAITEAITTMTTTPALIHTVYFWLKEGINESDIKAFEKGLSDLGKCPQIQTFYWGPPAPTEDRNVIDNSYAYAINVHFASIADEAAYQTEPLHLKFIDDHKDKWSKVVVYDNLIK